MATSSSSSPELTQAYVELRNITFSYLKSAALHCAVDLGIPNAIHRVGGGGGATLADILTAVPVPEHRQPFLPRLMRFLVATGILALEVDNNQAYYRLTPLSRLLVDDVRVNGCASLVPFVLLGFTNIQVSTALHLSAWFKGGNNGETPFWLAHGADLWDVMRRDPLVNKAFQDGLGPDTKLALDSVVTQYGEMFDGVDALVDVGGGNGSAARVIARAFPRVKCSVLDLPHVISNIQPSDDEDVVQYIAGDMMSSIPATDAVLLKYVLHDWNDEDCVKILKQCKKAIASGNKPSGGKVIIIDTVVGSPAKDVLEAQVTFDLLMMVMTTGKERDEQEWRKIFTEAGFKHYKTRPLLGFLSIIELHYPY